MYGPTCIFWANLTPFLRKARWDEWIDTTSERLHSSCNGARPVYLPEDADCTSSSDWGAPEVRGSGGSPDPLDLFSPASAVLSLTSCFMNSMAEDALDPRSSSSSDELSSDSEGEWVTDEDSGYHRATTAKRSRSPLQTKGIGNEQRPKVEMMALLCYCHYSNYVSLVLLCIANPYR